MIILLLFLILIAVLLCSPAGRSILSWTLAVLILILFLGNPAVQGAIQTALDPWLWAFLIVAGLLVAVGYMTYQRIQKEKGQKDKPIKATTRKA